jgi:3-hydroxybutyryl-CoA dehydrogenase
MTQKTIAILGSGVMGSGIAQMFAENQQQVLLWDIDPAFTEKGLAAIEKRLKRSMEKGKIDHEQLTNIMGRIKKAEQLEELHSADVVIEAVIEDYDAKTALYQQLESIVPEATVIGTNTSSLSIQKLSSSFSHPERFLGIHFFNPPTKLALVELIMTEHTAAGSAEEVSQLLTECGKTAVSVNDSPGFIVNRLLLPMINEAAKLVDTAMKLGALHPVGPLELADLIGLDVCQKILLEMVDKLGNPSFEPAGSLIKHIQSGHLGRKSGKGFYSYS